MSTITPPVTPVRGVLTTPTTRSNGVARNLPNLIQNHVVSPNTPHRRASRSVRFANPLLHRNLTSLFEGPAPTPLFDPPAISASNNVISFEPDTVEESPRIAAQDAAFATTHKIVLNILNKTSKNSDENPSNKRSRLN